MGFRVLSNTALGGNGSGVSELEAREGKRGEGGERNLRSSERAFWVGSLEASRKQGSSGRLWR